MSPDVKSQLAPHGVLRAAINMGNFLLVTGKTPDGDPDGVSPDMAREIARRLGVPVKFVPYAKPSQLADDAGTDTWDMLMTIDLFPTIAKLAGATLPDRKIDGLDVWPLISRQPNAKNPHDAYWFYYEVNQLQAVTSSDGRWKLQLPHTYHSMSGQEPGRDGVTGTYADRKLERTALFDLKNDIGEATDVSAAHPEIVRQLELEVEKARADLGDSLTNRPGPGRREPGRLAETK